MSHYKLVDHAMAIPSHIILPTWYLCKGGRRGECHWLRLVLIDRRARLRARYWCPWGWVDGLVCWEERKGKRGEMEERGSDVWWELGGGGAAHGVGAGIVRPVRFEGGAAFTPGGHLLGEGCRERFCLRCNCQSSC